MKFGFTNDETKYNDAVAFKEAAVNDGWSIEPTYKKLESVDNAATLKKDGFRCSILTRKNIGSWKFQADVTIWGPDSLQVLAPTVYNWTVIKSGLRRCNNCKKEDVDVFCVGFAGRVCEECLPSQRKKYEFPGWTN